MWAAGQCQPVLYFLGASVILTPGIHALDRPADRRAAEGAAFLRI